MVKYIMPDGTSMTPENKISKNWSANLPGGKLPDVQKFQIGGSTALVGSEMQHNTQTTVRPDLAGNEMYSPESVKVETDTGPAKSQIDKFTSFKEAPVNLLGEEDEARTRADQEYLFHSREEEFAKRDRIYNRLSKAENPQDVAAVLDVLHDFQDWSMSEANDPYAYRQYIKTAADGAKAYGKTHEQLQKERIVVGPFVQNEEGELEEQVAIGEDGYLVEGAQIRHRGYAIRVDTIKSGEKTRVKSTVRKSIDRKSGDPIESPITIEETEKVANYKEKIYFGTEEERNALANAHEELMRTLIIGKLVHEQQGIFDKYRAAIGELVKVHYLNGIGLNNEHIAWVFQAKDIKKITPEAPDNQEAGLRRSKTFRMMYLQGNCETKEKMEKHLNDTYNLEQLLDSDTIKRILKLQKTLGVQYVDSDAANMPDQVKAARFLLGKGLTRNETTGQWSVAWLNKDQRDPSKATSGEERGIKAVKLEKGVRGFLTEFGNPYARGSRDTTYQLANRMAMVLGEPSQTIDDVKIADRLFWMWGERDELSLEVYAPEAIPNGQEFLDAFNNLTAEDYGKWREWCDERLKYFAMPGEPVGSDLAKIFYPGYYRLKDLLNDRPTGSALTINGFDRLTQSLMTLARTEVNVGGQSVNRCMKEQLFGHKANDGLPAEPAKEMGEIEWSQVTTPATIEDALQSDDPETRTISQAARELGINSSAAADGATQYFWLMNFLAGDENPGKRPLAMINDESPDPKSFLKASGFTGKNKFITIVWHEPGQVFGQWREKQVEAIRAGKKLDKLVREQAEARWSLGRKNYWEGVRSLPDYPMWLDQTVRVRLPSGSSKTYNLLELIEGTESMPGMAVRFGFLDRTEAKRYPNKPTERFELIK